MYILSYRGILFTFLIPEKYHSLYGNDTNDLPMTLPVRERLVCCTPFHNAIVRSLCVVEWAAGWHSAAAEHDACVSTKCGSVHTIL
jgi:hypothetical protein